MKPCWFCNQPIVGKGERHHRVPRRYYKRGQDHRTNNIVMVHGDCHRRWNHEYNDPRLSRHHYLALFASINLGEGVFAQPTKAIEKPMQNANTARLAGRAS